MILRMCTFLLLLPALASSSRAGEPKKLDTTKSAPKNSITTDQAREALNQLMQSESFLADAPYMAPLKKRILDENKKESILELEWGKSAPGGECIGPWNVEFAANEFAYYARSPDRKELFTIRGKFVPGSDKRWSAKTLEASVTKLSNIFGQPEAKKIKKGMTVNEITELLGCPPGAYFSGTAAFTYPDGERGNNPFAGTRLECEKECAYLFSPGLKFTRSDRYRGWISNEIAIWVSFEDDGKVERSYVHRVTCPNEWWADRRD